MTTKKILVVDDNPTNMKLFVFLLASSDYTLETASNALEALEILERFTPDLMLLDLQLPDMDGLELTRRLKADPRTSKIPIVALTAYAMKGDEERARAAGVDAYLTKPIDKTDFRSAVASFLAGGEYPHGPANTR